jgi:uncharacterized radical SAM superfamily Fe-S cluster-containing enzyme
MCFEGRMKLKASRITISEVLKIIEEQTGIKKTDFLECTEFDFYLSKFIKSFGGIKTPSFCHPICYVYVDKDRLLPLNRLIDFKTLRIYLREAFREAKRSKLRYLYLCFSLFLTILKTITVKNGAKRGASFLFRFFTSLLMKNFINVKFNKIFRIDVFAYQDRYNADFRMFEKCNLLAPMPNGTLDSFCKRNILQTG